MSKYILLISNNMHTYEYIFIYIYIYINIALYYFTNI